MVCDNFQSEQATQALLELPLSTSCPCTNASNCRSSGEGCFDVVPCRCAKRVRISTSPSITHIVLHTIVTDNLNTGARSLVPFSKTECEDLLRTLNDARGNVILP